MYPRILDIPLPFEIGPIDSLTVYAYGFMVVIGVLVASWLAARELDRLFRVGRLSGVQMPVAEGERDRKRRRRPRTYTASPSILIGTIATIAILGGVFGAKLFYVLENMDRFFQDPSMVFSTGGLTYYGGFLVAAAGIAWFLRKHDLSVPTFADAIAPGLMLAYGIGRIGCYLAGDGDWGVCSSLANKPGFLPAWLWSETFPSSIVTDNVIAFNEARGEVCSIAADGVYPTMLYELFASVLIFAALWALRKHPYKSGWLFSAYLVFSGVERFLIEKIRVNPDYDLLGLTVTQAEVIAVFIILLGVGGLLLSWTKRDRAAEKKQAEVNREALSQQSEGERASAA
jgi:phosphatidylglycerol:prolipoprotein diacylglycerol transferase